MSPATKRRILVSIPVLVTGGCVVLSGCASADVVCDIRTDYAMEAPEADEGRVVILWKYRQDAYLPTGMYGLTECYGTGDDRFCLVRMRGSAASFHNICGIARVRHEEKHAFGAKHE